jgi:hypothetical protein
MRESQIERYLVKRVKALGGEVRKVAWIGRRGAPDRVVMVPYSDARCAMSTFWVELKAPGKKASVVQRREHARMRRVGQDVFVIDSPEGVDAFVKDALFA